ncbi:MAG: GPW/gp25 family protein [Acidimicrobiales bacterium]
MSDAHPAPRDIRSESDPHPSGFIGRGLPFPMRVDHTGSIALAGGAAELDSSMRVIISTAPGERLMRPTFGCRIWDLLFEPINGNTLGLMAFAVREAIAQWETRVEVDQVDVVPDPDREGMVVITVDYRVRSTNDRRNLVYPFYVIPHEED